MKAEAIPRNMCHRTIKSILTFKGVNRPRKIEKNHETSPARSWPRQNHGADHGPDKIMALRQDHGAGEKNDLQNFPNKFIENLTKSGPPRSWRPGKK